MNADETVKALRHCYQKDIYGCEGCPLNENNLCYEVSLDLLAADLIESLLAQLDAAIAGQETLQKALVESQRREREVRE